MKATAELQVMPLGDGVSVRCEVPRVADLLEDRDLIVEPHASGTNPEGDLQEIQAAVAEVHETLMRAT